MSGERACSRLVGGGQHGLTRGWVLVWEDSRWGIWEVGLGMRLGNWAETRSQRALESHCLSTSGAEGGFTRQLELESVGLVFHYPTCGSRADAASLAASHTHVSMGTLSGSRPGELGPQETSSQSLSKKKMEQVYWMAFQDLRETREPRFLGCHTSSPAMLAPSSLLPLGSSSTLMASDTTSPLMAKGPTREGHNLSHSPLHPQPNLSQTLNKYLLINT